MSETFQLRISGNVKPHDRYTVIAQSPADVPFDEAKKYYIAENGGCFYLVDKKTADECLKNMEIHIMYKRQPCHSLDELVDVANESTCGPVH